MDVPPSIFNMDGYIKNLVEDHLNKILSKTVLKTIEKPDKHIRKSISMPESLWNKLKQVPGSPSKHITLAVRMYLTAIKKRQ